MSTYPKVEIVEEGLREGMQIESVDISVDDKVRLLDEFSLTGLKTIVVGSFVSPRWTPQMADVDEVVRRFHPQPGVTYTAVALNDRGRERLAEHSPPLSSAPGPAQTALHLCDVFARRNTNYSQEDELARLDGVVDAAVGRGVTEAGIGLIAAFGSNWLGQFSEQEHLELLERQWSAWNARGIPVVQVKIADSMGWNLPNRTAALLRAVQARWPEIARFYLHLHDARGSAMLSAYAALETLDDRHTVIIDSAVGGMGGCPYCGHGRMTKMIPTEDLVDLLEELGIETGIDLERLIEVSHLAEKVVGHELWGHVSKAGPRPRGSRLFPMDMPMIETEQEAQHFRLGPSAYAGAPSPWKAPIESPKRAAAESRG